MFPSGLVAVAVMDSPEEAEAASVTLNAAFPLPFVVAVAEPRNVCPSPLPDASHDELEKKSSVNVVLGLLLSVP